MVAPDNSQPPAGAEAESRLANARAGACLVLGLASIVTFGAGSLASIVLWARVFFPAKEGRRFRMAASYIATIGVLLGGIGLAYAVYMAITVVRCPGNTYYSATGDALGLIVIPAIFLGPSLLGLLAAAVEQRFSRSPIRWVPVTLLGVLSLAGAALAWVVLFFAIMAECFG